MNLDSPEAKWVSAPAAITSSVSIVDVATTSEILSLAPDNDFMERSDNSLTVNLNLFAFLVLANPEVTDRQERYASYTGLRKWSGSITSGGTGEPLDLAGDGTLEMASESKGIGLLRLRTVAD